MKCDKEKFYYYDEKHDLAEYLEGKEDYYAHWVNPYLTLLLKRSNDVSLDDIIGFQIEGIKHFFEKAEEQKKEPLSKEAQKALDIILKELMDKKE